MSKAEELARKYCEGSSFEDACMEKPAYIAGYRQAEKDLEIAREEVIDKAVEWMKANITKYCIVRFNERNIPTPNYPFSEIMEKDFRKYMEKEE